MSRRRCRRRPTADVCACDRCTCVVRSTCAFAVDLVVLRVSRTAWPSPDLNDLPRVFGRPQVPVLSLHNIGDLFVPLSMQQAYARWAAANSRSHLFVPRTVRAVGHCDFAVAELQQGFDDLVGWVRTNRRPAGDDILNRRAVAEPTFGCRFTRTNRPSFGAACPT